MFVNIKVNGNRLIKFIFIAILIIILVIFSIGIYNIFFKNTDVAESNSESDTLTLTDTIKTDEIFEITENNYTNILEAVTNDVDSYVGCKVHFTGYIYRLIDFEDDEFVLARDMLINDNTSQSLVVGFLCTYDTAYEFEDDTWVDVTGTIIKGDYYGDIAQIDVSNMFECNEPENRYVSAPDDTYIPTSNMF